MERTKPGPIDIPPHSDRKKQIDTIKSVAGRLDAAADILERADKEMQEEGVQRQELAEKVAQLIREGKTQEALRALSRQHFSGFRETKAGKGTQYKLPLSDEEWEHIVTIAQNAPPHIRIPLNLIHESVERTLSLDELSERLRHEHVKEIDIQSALNNFFRQNQLPVRFVAHRNDRNQGVPHDRRIPHDQKRFTVYKWH